ncbi:MAG: MMPL family transporter [Candidatus Methanomethylophilus sp.]|nr:MMPL family transporter [Methanomethylophilus sp.]MDD4668738.1 MMPL family transporter [Methanomethylophilus sp.]
MFNKLAKFIINHSKAIVVVWLVVLVCCLPLAVHSGDVLQYDLTTMSGADSEATDGLELIDENFSTGLSMDTVIVLQYDSADELTEATALAGAGTESGLLQSAFDEHYGPGVFTISSLGRYNGSSDVNTSGIVLVSVGLNDDSIDLTHQTDDIRSIISDTLSTTGYTDLTTYVTGTDALAYDTEMMSVSDVEKIDPLSVALIFIILAVFFWAFVTALVPPAVTGMAYGVVMALLYGIGSYFDVYYITKIIVLVSMLGAGSDYAIFIITRYREERKNGKDNDYALTQAVEWAGESVFTSGLSVIIGFGTLSLCTFSMIQTMGMVLALGIVMALFATLTFIPALIHLLDGKIFWPSTIEFYQRESKERKGFHGHLFNGARRYFTWVSKVTRKHAKAIVAATILVTCPAAYLVATTDDSYDMISIMPDSESVDGLNILMDNTDGATIMPNYVVLELDSAICTTSDLTLTVPVTDSTGNITAVPTSLGLVYWTADGVGYLQDIAEIENQISTDHSDIVSTVSGPMSWAAIYNTAAAALGTDDPTVVNTYIIANGVLPDALATYFEEAFTLMGYNMAPTDYLAAPSTDYPTGVRVMNVADYLLNYGLGLISNDGTCVQLSIITGEKPMSDNTMTFVQDLKTEFHDGTESYDTEYSDMIAASYVSGTSAVMNDISVIVEDQFNWIRVAVIALIILLLFFVLGSYLTPIRSTLTIVMSILWTLALTHLIFTDVFAIPVIWVVPIVLFVILLGLGMDYDILLTTRVRENVMKGASNDDAVDHAVKFSGAIITLCGLLMGGTFLTLLIGNSSMLQEFGFALGFGILIDSLFMVTYFVPALMHLMGKWNWKGPKFLQRTHPMNGLVDPEHKN